MTTKYQRIPLIVDALFMTDGSFQPLKLIYHTATPYIISRQRYIIKRHYKVWYILDERRGNYVGKQVLDLPFEFAVAIVNLVDDVTAPKSSLLNRQAEQQHAGH